MPPSERLRRRLGEHEITRAIARGGMGAVYEVRNVRTGVVYAAKVILRPGDSAARTRFQREAELLARCEHPGIVKIHTMGESGEELYMILDLVKGEDLGTVVERTGPLEPRRAAAIALEIARALEFVHARGIIHRDVKPSNVLVDMEGHAHLTDFGIATATDLERLTRTGAFVGTVAFVSPEQAGAREVGPPTDIFSLGGVLFHALSGQPPLGEEGVTTLARLATPARVRDLRAVAPGVPAPLACIVARALEKDAGDRYASADALADDLLAFLEGRPVAASPRRKRASLAALALVVLACVVALAAWRSRGRASEVATGPEEGSPAQRIVRARALLASGRLDEARRSLDGVPETPATLEALGDVAMVASDFATAESAYGRALPSTPSLLVKHAEAAALAGDVAASASDLRLLLASPRSAHDARLAAPLVRRALAETDLAARTKDLEAGLRLDPTNALAREGARALAVAADSEVAAWSAKLQNEAAFTRSEVDRLLEIYGRWSLAFATDPTLPAVGLPALRSVLQNVRAFQSHELMGELARRFLGSWPDDARWLTVLGAEESMGEAAERASARKHLERAADALAARGTDSDEVAFVALEVVRTLHKLATALAAGQLDVERIERCAARTGDDAYSWFLVADVWRHNKNLARARVALDRALALQAKQGQLEGFAIEIVAQVLWDEKRTDEAAAFVLSVKDRGQAGLRVYVRSLMANAQDEEILRAVPASTTDPVVLVVRGSALVRLRRLDEARAALARLESLGARGESDDLRRAIAGAK